MNYHKLLSKQINKYLPGELQKDETVLKFLSAVNDSYLALERDKELSERAFNITEEEYIELNKKLKHEADVKKLSIQKLKEAVGTITGAEKQNDSEDLLGIARYLNRQINERKSAEQIFTSLITNMKSGILLENETGYIVFANQAFCDLFSVTSTPQSLQGMHGIDSAKERKTAFLDPEQFVNDKIRIIENKLLITGEILELVNGRIFQRDYIPIIIDNKYKGHLWNYTDITEIKKHQYTLEQSELKNRLIMNASLDAIITMDINGQITFWNPHAEKIFGWTEQEVLGKRASDTIIPSLKREAHDIGLHHYAESHSGPFLNKQIELTAINKSGKEFPVELSVIPVKHGVNEFFCSFIRDISERKKNEAELERLSFIIQETINAVIITDADGKVEWVNNAFYKVTGYTFEEMKGKIPGKILQGMDTDPATVKFISDKLRKAETFTCEIYNYKKSGAGYWLRINCQPIFDQNGKVIQFFAIEEDITKEKAAEMQLKEFDRRINLALQKIGDNVWEHNFLTGETVFSQQEFSLLGYSTGEFISTVDLWYSCIYKDDKKLVDDNDIKYKTGQIDHHILEYRIVNKSGKVKWVLDRGVVIEKSKDGKPLRIIGTHTDITQQKEIEKELEATATRLSSLITNLHAGVLLENEDNTIAFLNYRYCELFNITADPVKMIGEVSSKSVNKTKHLFKDPEFLITRINELLNHKKLVTGEVLDLVDGRYFERDFIPIWNEGRYNGHLWMYTDITEKINAEKKLEEQRVFYEEILDNIPADIAVFDNKHQYLFVNPKGIKDPELRKWIIGKRDEDYVKFRNKSRLFLEGRRKLFNSILKTKKLKSWEEELIQPDGKSQFIMRHMYPVLNQNKDIKLVIGYGVDITNIKNIQLQIEQSEKKYRDVIDNSLALVTTHDLEGKFISVNPMVCKIYGYKEEAIIGHFLTEFMLEEDKAQFNELYLQKIINEKNASGIFRVMNTNGEVVYTLFNNYLKEEPGKEPYVIGFGVDISDRIKAEKELKIAKKTTEELAKSKQNFLANMSHEIRTPMNAIMGMANQLNKTPLNKDQQFYLNTIHSATDNLLIIINDILDISKIEAGKLTIEKIGFQPKMVVERVMQVMMHKAEEKGILLTNSFCDSRLSPVLIGDPYRLNQVLLNFISNSIKFTHKGSVDISCSVIEDDDLAQKVKVSVNDTGIGMEEGNIKNLFEKFTQEDESVTRKFGGTGLGLSICKELIELMGGDIEVESKKGIGTTFSFIITFNKGSEDQLPVKETHNIDAGFLTDKTILIADDYELNRLVASTILKSYGAKIEEAKNGEEAIKILKLHKIDLVLMDIQMPEMDGIEATKIIRKDISKDLPVIALTAYAIKGDDAKFITAGMNDYLAKPFEENQLLHIASKWLKIEPVKKPLIIIDDKKESEQLYSLAKLKAIAPDNNEFISRMILLFITQIPASLEEMKSAYREDNFSKVKRIAHRLIPSMDNMGIESLKNEIREIEDFAESYKNSEKLFGLISHLERTIMKVVTDLKANESSFF